MTYLRHFGLCLIVMGVSLWITGCGDKGIINKHVGNAVYFPDGTAFSGTFKYDPTLIPTVTQGAKGEQGEKGDTGAQGPAGVCPDCSDTTTATVVTNDFISYEVNENGTFFSMCPEVATLWDTCKLDGMLDFSPQPVAFDPVTQKYHKVWAANTSAINQSSFLECSNGSGTTRYAIGANMKTNTLSQGSCYSEPVTTGVVSSGSTRYHHIFPFGDGIGYYKDRLTMVQCPGDAKYSSCTIGTQAVVNMGPDEGRFLWASPLEGIDYRGTTMICRRGDDTFKFKIPMTNTNGVCR